ncbi:hypothetical protein [Acidiplasma cupricumulans]|uniref:hypothetical protein n=1 Tax=Acidiplasma cupricumulans TaxID=312540 RepID=UPI0007837E04|nr:hypothetical protein [Acidiplasma cupricumulans]
MPDVYKALLYVLASTRTRNIKMVKTSSLSCRRIIMDEKSFYYYMTEIVVCMRAYHKRKPDKTMIIHQFRHLKIVSVFYT